MLNLYLPLTDTAAIYDNSGAGRVLIAQKDSVGQPVVYDAHRWAMITEQAGP